MYQVLEKDAHKYFGEVGIKGMWREYASMVQQKQLWFVTTDRAAKDFDYVGVDLQQQRRGIGKMLLDWTVEKAAEDQKSIYLVATPAGRPLYQAAGFEYLGTLQLFGVQHYSMIRKYSLQ